MAGISGTPEADMLTDWPAEMGGIRPIGGKPDIWPPARVSDHRRTGWMNAFLCHERHSTPCRCPRCGGRMSWRNEAKDSATWQVRARPQPPVMRFNYGPADR